MVGANLKAETMKLMEKRTAIEAEMNAVIERLCQPGGPGLTGNLVDSEGFPRSDIDIPVVRAERRRLAELRNDHSVITDKINGNIQVLHSAKLAPSSQKDSGVNEGINDQNASFVNIGSKDSPNTDDMDAISTIPFAMVDEIADASPAAEDGLQLGDQILKFGNVTAGDNLLQKLGSEVQANQGQGIAIVVLRQGAPVNITVTPRPWQGRGLLGCHFRIV